MIDTECIGVKMELIDVKAELIATRDDKWELSRLNSELRAKAVIDAETIAKLRSQLKNRTGE